MTLEDKQAYRNVIGSLMHQPGLMLEYDIRPEDFINCQLARIVYCTIRNLYNNGLVSLSPIEIDQEILTHGGIAQHVYETNGGSEFLVNCYETCEPSNFQFYYDKLKKNALIYELKKAHYDVSDFYKDPVDIKNPVEEQKLQAKLDSASLDDILTASESKLNEIRTVFQSSHTRGDMSEGLDDLLKELAQHPSYGPSLEGELFNLAVRGAREGCLYIRSASSSTGKSRAAIYDASHLCYPIHWDTKKQTFVMKMVNNQIMEPRKVLFIVTEMQKNELQTIVLSYLSGVNEEHILMHRYDIGEEIRVRFAASIMKKYHGYFLVEEISDPNLENVKATIKRYATVEQVQFIFYDYIHTSPSLLSAFKGIGIREDVALMMMTNQLKELAKEYGVFIFSATQVNATGMAADGGFKNELALRGAKSIADKADVACIMSKVDEKMSNSLQSTLRQAVRESKIAAETLAMVPTHVIDIYKNRQGRYKNIRIFTKLDLGTGERQDLFMTTEANTPINFPNGIQLFEEYEEKKIENWEGAFRNELSFSF